MAASNRRQSALVGDIMKTFVRQLQAGMAVVLVSGLACAPPAPTLPSIPKGPAAVELQTVASGLVSPDYLTHAGDGTGRLFIVDQVGTIRLVKNGQLVDRPFLDIRSRIVALRPIYDDRGLLGLTFHPGFADPSSPGFRRLYTFQTEPVDGPADFTVPLPAGASFNNQVMVSEWQIDPGDPDVVDLGTARTVLRIDYPGGNHAGGQIVFGPGGLLYIAVADGGSEKDLGPGHSPQGNGQDTTNVLGKILRIDPLVPATTSDNVGPVSANGQYRVPADNPFLAGGGVSEIFAYGFRNPYRFSFDPQNGDLHAGDVGQDMIEEVDLVTRGGNYGWRVKEGTFLFDPTSGTDTTNSPGSPAGLIDPVLEYDHTQGEAIIGGFVYRGTALPDLAGQYVFGDLSRSLVVPQGRLFYAPPHGSQIRELIIGQDDRGLGLFVKGFGRDEQGELYVLGSKAIGPAGTSGVALKLVPVTSGP